MFFFFSSLVGCRFFGFKRFENYLKMEADPVVISLHSDIQAFEAFLKDGKAYDGRLFDMLLTVLSEKVFSDDCNMVSYQNELVRLVTTPEIMDRFRDRCMTLDEPKFKFMYSVAEFIKSRMPMSAADALTGVVSFSIARLGMAKDNPESARLLVKFQELFQSFQEKRLKDEGEMRARKAPARGKFSGEYFSTTG